MKRNRRTLLQIILLILLLTAVVQPAAAQGGDELPTHQLIIKYKPTVKLTGADAPTGSKRMQQLNKAAGVGVQYGRQMSDAAHVLRLPERLPLAQVEAIAQKIAALPEVEYAEPDRLMFPAFTPSDPLYSSQWHYFEANGGVNAPAAWDITTGSGAVKIAVLDSGITDHPDLAGRWVGGYDFVSNLAYANDGDGRDSNPHDPGNWVTATESASGPLAGCTVTNSTWHGTHVAGTIGAAGNNGSGVVGLNWVSLVVPVRVLGKCGGFVSDIADGLRWAAGLPVSGVTANANPAKVLNLSLSGPGTCSTTYQNAIDAVNAVGAIVVVGAGNNNANLNTTTIQPANCNGVITVAAIDRGGQRAIYSNYGSTVEISAPGGETLPTASNGVYSTLNTGLTAPAAASYGYSQGTSMATPHVSGVVSLLLSLNPGLIYAQVLQILQDTARPFPTGSNCTTATCGSGIVDAAAALGAVTPVATATPIPPTSTATPLPPTSTATQPAQPLRYHRPRARPRRGRRRARPLRYRPRARPRRCHRRARPLRYRRPRVRPRRCHRRARPLRYRRPRVRPLRYRPQARLRRRQPILRRQPPRLRGRLPRRLSIMSSICPLSSNSWCVLPTNLV